MNVHCVVPEQRQMITALPLLNRGAECHALEFREVVPSSAVEVLDKVFGCAAQAVVIIQHLEPLAAQHDTTLLMADDLPVVTARPPGQLV